MDIDWNVGSTRNESDALRNTERRVDGEDREADLGVAKSTRQKNATEDFEPYVARIESDYRDMQETLLTAGMSGLNLAVVFHEVERGVRALNQVITKGGDLEEAARQVPSARLYLVVALFWTRMAGLQRRRRPRSR